MAHADHFLTRLDRLAGGDVELALELYRDPELLRTIVTSSGLTDNAERLAISLDDPEEGPFLVVTREGAFVTCLARGMRAPNLPVVTRGQLDACGRRVTRLRDKLALASRVKEQDRKTRHILRRLFEASDAVSREDFLEIAELEPLFGGSFLTTYAAMGAELVEAGPLVRRARPRGARGRAMLRDYWNLLHATGHLALLGSMTRDRDAFAQLSEGVAGSRAALSFPLVGTGVVAFILKGAWAAGRLGKLVMPAYKRALAEDVALYDLFDTLIALLAIGTRTRGLRAEIQKAVRAAPNRAETPEAKRLREGASKEIRLTCQLTADLLDADPERLEEDLHALGESFFFDPSAPPPRDDPRARDLARTLPLMSRTDGLSDGRKLINTLHLVAASAAGPPEQFYLPRALLTKLREPWRPADTLQILEPRLAVDRQQRRPVVRTETVGRNDPCPCGSGRKWKRCCGA